MKREKVEQVLHITAKDAALYLEIAKLVEDGVWKAPIRQAIGSAYMKAFERIFTAKREYIFTGADGGTTVTPQRRPNTYFNAKTGVLRAYDPIGLLDEVAALCRGDLITDDGKVDGMRFYSDIREVRGK